MNQLDQPATNQPSESISAQEYQALLNALRQTQQRQEFLLRLNDALAPSADPVEIQQIAARLLGEQLQADRTYYAWVEGDYEVAIIEREYRRGTAPSVVGKHAFADFGSTDAAYRQGRTMILSDVEDGHSVPDSDLPAFRALSIRSLVSTPLVKQGKTVASMTVLKGQPHQWTEQEVSLVQETAERTWAAVERANAEKALQKSEEKYRTLFDSMDEGVHISELLYNEAGQPIDWRYLEVNAVFQRQTGLLNATGQLGSVTTPNTEPYWLEAYDQVLKSGEPLRFENHHAATGRWYSAYASRVGGAGSRLFAVIFDDTTDRKEKEATLHASQQRFESIANLVPDLLWESEPDGSTSWYNQRWLEYTGQRFKEAIGWGWTQAIHPDDREASVNRYREAAEEGQSLRQEHRIQRHDGVYHWFVVNAIPLLDERGQVVKMYGTATDIHKSRLAEATLQESEKRLRLAIEATELATWEWNLVTNEVYWNEQHFWLFGMEPQPQPLTPEVFMNHVQPHERERISRLLQQAIAERSVYKAEFCALLEDGTSRWMSGYGRVVEEQDGQPLRMSGVMFDVDERRRAEDALRLTDQRKDEFLAMLAHELRNPMSTLRSGLQILTLIDGKDPVSSDTIAMMNRQTDHLVRMVDDLLDVSRISQGKIELKQQRLNLVEVVAQSAESVQPLYQEQGRVLQLDLPRARIEVDGDRDRLTQVVTNLLTNGARYTGERGQVWLSLYHRHQEAIFQVRDNGIGLAADQLSAIFELFVQVDTSLARSKGGLGIGLTLVKRLVELHGGRVAVQSEGLGQGSTFTVHLPTLAPVAEPTTIAALPHQDPSAARRILVIDDNADAGLMLTMLLKLKGYEAHSRTSGRAGLEAAESLRPAAILLDIGMPELDGYATCRLIRAQAWGGHVVVIALTGYGQEDDRQRTSEAGFDGHLVKPVDLETLTKLLTDLLSNRQKSTG